MNLTCDEARIQCSALIDGELKDDKIIKTLLNHLESCYNCRNEYLQLVEINAKMNNIKIPEPEQEWWDSLPQKVIRRFSGGIGLLFFVGSYLLLLGYSIFTTLLKPDVSQIIKFSILGIVVGIIILISVSIADRIKEAKNDKYKGVIR